MKTILVFNESSAAARHAIRFALSIAKRAHANVLLANTVNVNKKSVVRVAAGHDVEATGELLLYGGGLQSIADFRPEIEELAVSAMDECTMAELINKKQIWMIVKGMQDVLPPAIVKRRLNTHAILSKVRCPLLVVPEQWPLKAIDRMVYITDLRYCQTEIVRYLAELGRPWNADVFIANLTAKGLPGMAEEYAQNIFERVICNQIDYDHLFINDIREKNIQKVVDVLTNDLRNDIIVLVNRHLHFEEIIGDYLTDLLPDLVTTPVLIFPY